MHEGTYGDLLDGDDSGDDLLGYEGITEIMGDDEAGAEFVGDESGDDLMGASKKRAARNAAMKNALLRKRIGAGALLRSLAPRSAREYVIGLGSTAIPAGASANIGVQPQVLFRPERIVIPSTIAADFLITDIKVGKNSQLVAPGAIPAIVFAENAFGVRLKMDTSQIAQFVTLSITNQNAAARNFQGAIIGPAVE